MVFEESYRRILYKLGYYNYQHGFIVRHINQEEGWNSHLEKCRNFILRAIELHKPEKVTVLGSGWLLELPLTEMLEKVNEVCLVDIIHPPEVIRQVSGMKGVELITEDVSGGLVEEIWKHTARLPFFAKLKSLSGIEVPEYKPGRDPGMVISLNILTQLETLPLKQLLKKTTADEESINRFRKEIQDKHISFLKRNKSVLITDVTEIVTAKSGIVTENQTVITSLPEGHYHEEWTWDFDLKRSDYFENRSVLKVNAIMI